MRKPLLAVTLLTALCIGPLVHNLVLHSHGDHHARSDSSSAQSAAWESLHAITNHSSEVLLVAEAAFLVFLAIFFPLSRAVSQNAYLLSCRNRPRHSRYVYSGIAPYRCFP
jgi:hypothetical protein